MDYAQHIAEAHLCLASEPLLMESGSRLVAAEAIWGAAVQVIDAANHARGVNRHPTNNARRTYILEQLEDEFDLGDELSNGLRVATRRLHTHFYRGHLNDDQLRTSIEEGRDFINRMIELLDRKLVADSSVAE